MYIDSSEIISETLNNISKIGSVLFNSMISTSGGLLVLLLFVAYGILRIATR